MPQAIRDSHLPVGRLYLIAVWGAVETRQLSQFHLKAALTNGRLSPESSRYRLPFDGSAIALRFHSRAELNSRGNKVQTEIDARMLSASEPEWSARVYGKQPFAGAGKTNSGMLVPLERRLTAFILPRIPRWLETYHLTLLTPVWAIGIALFGYLSASNLRWLWMTNLMMVMHYFTDHFDGKVGKYRNTGLRKWGFYMDHLFDYVFLCSILIGYSFLIPQQSIFSMLLVLCVFSAFMFHTFLMLAATDEFRVSFSRFGPTELRIALIVINVFIIRFGTRGLEGALPWVALGGVIALSFLAFIAQRRLWQIDMKAKAEDNASEN
jgi:phosphatidylglycerophosphate synthase